MAYVYRQYEDSNSSALENSITRGEYLYALKLLNSNPSFVNEQGVVLRMKISLAFVETKAVVIDAYIQTDKNLAYLFILCSSPLKQEKFAKIVKKNLPKVIIEKFFIPEAMEYIKNACVQKLLEKNATLFANIKQKDKTKEFLLSLLIEYKAMLLETPRKGLLNNCVNKKRQEFFSSFSNISKPELKNLNVEIIFFEKNKRILCIPVFQVCKIDKDIFQKKYIQILPDYGGKRIFIDEVFFIKTINISKTIFEKKIEKGIYNIEIENLAGAGRKTSFNFLIPSLF